MNDRLSGANHGAAAEPDAFERPERHHERPPAAEANDFTGHWRPVPTREKLAAVAHRKGRRGATDLNQHAENRRNAAVIQPFGDSVDFGHEGLSKGQGKASQSIVFIGRFVLPAKGSFARSV